MSIGEILNFRKDEPELARELLMEVPLRVERAASKGISNLKVGYRNQGDTEEALCQFPNFDLGTNLQVLFVFISLCFIDDCFHIFWFGSDDDVSLGSASSTGGSIPCHQ